MNGVVIQEMPVLFGNLNVKKSRLINEGFKINWNNYQLILQMFNERFKIYAPYLGK